MKGSTFALIALLGLGVVTLDLTWVRAWPWLRAAVQLPLLFVLLVALHADWRQSVSLAVFLGLVYQLYSVWPVPIYPLAFGIAAGGAWFLSRRLTTARSGLSYLFSIGGGTVVYYLAMGILLLAYRLWQNSALMPAWPIWWQAFGWQVITHPLLAGAWWVISGQRRTAVHIRAMER